MKYEIEITETLSKIFHVKADTIEKAEEIASKKYYRGIYVLSSDHYQGVKFKAVSQNTDTFQKGAA